MKNNNIQQKIVLLYAAPSVAMIDQCLPIIHEMTQESSLIKVIAFREEAVLNQLQTRENLNTIVAESFDYFLVPGRFKWKNIDLRYHKKNNVILNQDLPEYSHKKNKLIRYELPSSFIQRIITSSRYRKFYKRLFSHPIKLNGLLKRKFQGDEIVILTDIEIMHKKEAQKHLKNFTASKWISFPHGIVLDNKEPVKQHTYYKQFKKIYFFSSCNIKLPEDANLDSKIKLIPIPRHSNSWLNTLSKLEVTSKFSEQNLSKTVLLISSATNSFRKKEKYQYIMDILTACKIESLNVLLMTHPKENDIEIFEITAKELNYTGVITHLKKNILTLDLRPRCAISLGSTVDFDIMRLGIPLFIHHDFKFDNEINNALNPRYGLDEVVNISDKIVHITDKIAYSRISHNIASWSFDHKSLLNNLKSLQTNDDLVKPQQKYEALFLAPVKNNSRLIAEITEAF